MPAMHPATPCLRSDRHRRILWCADGELAWRAGAGKDARAVAKQHQQAPSHKNQNA